MKFESISQLIEIIGLTQGLIIGFYFILKKNNREINLLGLFLLSFSMPFISYFIREMDLLKTTPSLFFLPVGFYFMTVPLYFLYVENLIYKINKISILKHLSIGLIEFSIFLILYLIPADLSVSLFYRFEWLYNFTYACILNVFCLSYLSYILYRLKIYKERALHVNSNDNINASWLQKTTILLMVMYCFQLIASKAIILDIYKEIIYIADSIMATVFIYWISIFGIKNRGMVKLEDTPKATTQKNDELEESDFLKLKALILEEKLFKNTNLNIYILSEVSGMSTRKISQLINYFHENNFNSFINTFRINEAKMMIDSQDFEHYTIVAIAKEAGFNSKSSFNAYFKNHEGMTPTAYKANAQIMSKIADK